MDESLSVNLTTRVRIPLNVLFFFFFLFFVSPLFLFFLSLLAWADICAAELATWGVGPDVKTLRWYANSVGLDITTALF